MIKRILKSLLSLSIAFLLWGMVQDIQSAFSETLAAGGRPPISVICLVAAYLLFSIFLLIVLWAPRIMNPLNEMRTRCGWPCGMAAVVLAVLISWLFCASFWSNILTGSYLRGGAIAVTLGVMAWLLGSKHKAAYEWNSILKACLIFGAVFIFAYQLRSVVNYPFSLSWAEGNRFWDYSVLFGRRL